MTLSCTGRCEAQSTTTDSPGLANQATVDFASEVVPVLTQAGCNSGACHGAAAGRGYLKLSLFGSRPNEDYEALLFALPGRFVDLQRPLSSLILQKPGGYLEHGGGVRIDSHGPAFRVIADWIRQGSSGGSMAGISKLQIQPSTVVDAPIGQALRLHVEAQATDGTPRQIQRWLSLTEALPAGTPNATVEYRLLDDALELTPRMAGYWPVTIRAGSQAVTVQLFVNPSSQPAAIPSSTGSNSQPAENTLETNTLETMTAPESMDALVHRAHQRLGLSAAEQCTPPLLARRLWLDLAGRHPTWIEWQATIAELEQGNIDAVVERLLDSGEFARRAGEVLANWGAAHSSTDQSAAPLAKAIADELLVSDNLQHLVRKMLLVPSHRPVSHPVDLPAESPADNPAAAASISSAGPDPLTAFHRFASDPRQRAELIAATWLGVRVGCAQCHDHPLDHWTQDDYFAMAACWAEIETGAGDQNTVRRIAGRTTTDLRSGREAVPRLPGDLRNLNEPPPETALTGGLAARLPEDVEAIEASQGTTADEAWVAWLSDEGNPQFSRNLANRVWAWLFGSGLVMELDDHRATNPAIHEALLEHLAEHLAESDFSLRSLIRKIVLRDAYARAVEVPRDGATLIDSLFTQSPLPEPKASRLHRLMLSVRVPKPIDRPLPQLAADALGSIGNPAVADAPHISSMEIVAGNCSRAQPCRDPFAESLELVAGEELNAFIAAVVRKHWNSSQSPLGLLDDFHFKLFGRGLNAEEMEHFRTQGLDQPEPAHPLPEAASVVEDIVWSWLVSPAFRQQH